MKLGYATDMSSMSLDFSETNASRFGSLNGGGRSSTALITLKMAVLAPMPSASVSTATVAKPGFLNSWRIANFKSFMDSLDFDFRFQNGDLVLDRPRSVRTDQAARLPNPKLKNHLPH